MTDKAATGHVYFVKCGAFIKIGFSKNVPARLKELQTGAPEKLELIGVAPGTLKTETAIHKLLNQCRTTNEWFGDCSEVRAAMLRLQLGEIELSAEPVTGRNREKTRSIIEAAPAVQLPGLDDWVKKWAGDEHAKNFDRVMNAVGVARASIRKLELLFADLGPIAEIKNAHRVTSISLAICEQAFNRTSDFYCNPDGFDWPEERRAMEKQGMLQLIEDAEQASQSALKKAMAIGQGATS